MDSEVTSMITDFGSGANQLDSENPY